MDNKKAMLIILDGFGESESTEGNSVKLAKTPYFDKLFSDNPVTLINASGEYVGLPDGQMGNSEVGHLNIGAGRVVFQDLSRINKAIADGDFDQNEAFVKAVDNAKAHDSAVHIMGLTSNGGVHSFESHYFAIIDLCAKYGLKKVYFHAFTDGRDTPTTSGLGYVQALEEHMKQAGTGKVASIIGRYYAMDRDNHYERVVKAYDLLTKGEGEEFDSATAAFESSYAENVTDEFITAKSIVFENGEKGIIRDNDSVIFFDFRADRARQITKAFTQDDFNGFERKRLDLTFVTMTEYEAGLKNLEMAFGPKEVKNTLGKYLSDLGLKQLRIAETEKYAHVTYFFNGGVETVLEGEDRVLVPSPRVATYDLKPEMSAYEVTEKLLEAIGSDKYDFIAVNYANTDMVGHTGILEAAIKAVETVDDCCSQIIPKAVEHGYSILVTADHGNCEKMIENGEAHTAHTTNPVKLCCISNIAKSLEPGSLCDIAPTLLDLMGLDEPEEMSGKSLLVK